MADIKEENLKKIEDGKTPENEEDKGFLYEVLDTLKILAFAFVAAYFINHVLIANSYVPSGSMENTIMTGDRVFGSRLKYKYSDIERGDVSIFTYGYKCKECGQVYRENEGVCPFCGRADKKNKKIFYVKRVIGLPGDHIEIRKTGTADPSKFEKVNVRPDSGDIPVGKVFINGEELKEDYLPEPMIVDGNRFPEIDVTVPEGHYFMMGDNRNNSMDARYWDVNRFVEHDKIFAKVYIKYWPLKDAGKVK